MFSNDQNLDFYRSVPRDKFDLMATVPAGLSDLADLKRLIPRLGFHPLSCMELGAGTGRVVEFLDLLRPQPQIFALERTPEFVEGLRERFKRKPNIEIIDGDLLTHDLPNAELALWMFSGICEFSRSEQQFMVDKISRSASRALVVDVLAAEEVWGLTEKHGNFLTTKHEYGGTLFLEFPTIEDIESFRKSSHFVTIESYDYKSQSERLRRAFILRK